MKKDEFQCYQCKGIFKKELTEQEEIEQLKKEFGENWTPKECERVCDDCYKKIYAWMHKGEK